MINVLITRDADPSKIAMASHTTSLSDALNQAANWLAHPEEDASVFADGLWESWREGHGEAMASHRGYTARVWDEHAISQRER